MSDLSYAERMEEAQTAARYERARRITEAWNGYLVEIDKARKAMPGHPVGIDVNHIIACRKAMAEAEQLLDDIEVQLPASKMHVAGVEL